MKKHLSHKENATPYLIMLMCFIALVACYFITLHIFRGVELDRASSKLALYETTIDNELTRLSHLPPVLAEEQLVKLAALGGSTKRLNLKLKKISNSARAEAIYLMDKNGLTIASSNFDADKTFLGQNYGFRPYFKKSMEGKNSTFFAIGATTSRPGFFLSSPVKIGDEVIAVLALKLDLTALNQTLQATDDLVLVTNPDDIILLSSNPEWRYKATASITKDRLEEIALERQFGREKLNNLSWKLGDSDDVNIEGATYIKASKRLSNGLWTLIYLQANNVLHKRAIISAAALLLLMGAATLTLVFWRQKRLRQALEASQRSRTRLQNEIEVRRLAERNLRNAQDELERTSKMVALGQLAASITHELGQPISAMKNHIAAEEIKKSAPIKLLSNLTSILQRMENITRQLRFFSTGSDTVRERVHLNRVINGALQLMSYSLEKEHVELTTKGLSQTIYVLGSHQRLEQVVINLLRNAMKAMTDKKKRKINLVLSKKGKEALLRVEDTGHGLQGQSLETLTEPFHTTGRSGEGMGLGLAISASIIAEHNGTINAGDNKSSGAWFEVSLPLATSKAVQKQKEETLT